MDFHHVIEAAGIVALGLVFYSYLRRWLESTARIDRRLRVLLNGVVFGGLSITLMISRIEFAPGAYVDARAVPIARTWCGFRPWAPDSLPVLGPWPGVAGLFVATGHFRNGILLAPITARLLTEWITGKALSVDVPDFLPDRFLRVRSSPGRSTS